MAAVLPVADDGGAGASVAAGLAACAGVTTVVSTIVGDGDGSAVGAVGSVAQAMAAAQQGGESRANRKELLPHCQSKYPLSEIVRIRIFRIWGLAGLEPSGGREYPILKIQQSGKSCF